MEKNIIEKEISQKVIMTGVKYKDDHPGGISSVVRYWSNYIEDLQYYAEFKEGSALAKITIFIWALIRVFFKLLFDLKIRIVHVHTAEETDFKRNSIIIKIAKMFGKKVILHSHGATFVECYEKRDDQGKVWVKSVLNKTDLIIVLSQSWKDWFMSIGIPESKLIILHNITAYPKEVLVQKDENKVRIIFLGEIGPRKGVFDVLGAIAEHKDILKDEIELHIGGNKMEDELMNFIEKNDLGGFVYFDGFVCGGKKIELLNWANVFILPSFNEGLPISILEAMAYRMPIISSPVGGIPEVVDETNGILVTPGNKDEIFNAINFYVNKREMIAKHGEESYKKAKTYLPDYVLNHLKNIYQQFL